MDDIQDYIVILLVGLISAAVVRAIIRKARTTSRLPPSPQALPIIGHLHLLAPIPHQALHKLSAKFGPLMHICLGSVPCIVASSPEIAKEFLKTNESSFSDRPITTAIDYLTYGSADFSFSPYGPYWKFMKKIIMSELLGGRTLDQLYPLRRQELQNFLSSMSRRAKAGESVDVGAKLILLTNNIISRMLMNQRCAENKDDADDVKTLIHDVAEITGKFNLSDYIWFCKNLDLQGFQRRLKKVHERFETMMERIIKEHQEARMKREADGDTKGDSITDLLDILLDIAENENSEIKLTMENIKAFILDIFVAGTDTSAITTEWALAELINHPNIMRKARQEIDSVVGESRIVEESDIKNLPYLQAVVKETLRLHPSGPIIVRQSSENCNIRGYDIPAKTQLFVNVWAIGRDPKYWDNPLEFKPERFVETEGESSKSDVRGQHFHLLPFGSGRRGCPGTTLALLVVQTTLAAMIQCFEWEVSDGRVDMEEGLGLTLPRARPLVCIPSERIAPFAPL